MPITSDFVPKRRLIQNVTQALKAVVTTTEDHEYTTGDYIRIIVPRSYGMDLDYIQTKIMVTGTTTFETEINTLSQLPFVAPSFPPGFTTAQAVPMGTESNSVEGATHNMAM